MLDAVGENRRGWIGYPGLCLWRMGDGPLCAEVLQKGRESRLVIWNEDSRRVLWDGPIPHPRVWGLSQMEALVCMATYVRKVIEEERERRSRPSGDVAVWAGAYPALWEFLTLDRYDDGQQRLTAMLIMFVEEDAFKVALQDRQEGRSTWVTADTPNNALVLLEGNLASGKAEWRKMKGQGSGNSQKGGRR
jgi:hypothetical protein